MDSLLSINLSCDPIPPPPALTNYTLPTTLATYYTCIINEINASNQTIGEYVTQKFNVSYNRTPFINSADTNFTNALGKVGRGCFTSSGVPFGNQTNPVTGIFARNTSFSRTYTSNRNGMSLAFWLKVDISGNAVSSGNNPPQLSNRIPMQFGTPANYIFPEIVINASTGALISANLYFRTGVARFSSINTTTNPRLPTVNMANWNHFCFTCTGGTQPKNLYVNNVACSTTDFSSMGSTAFNSLTTVGIQLPNNLNSSFNEIRIYTESLNSTNVANLYNWNGVGQPNYI